MGWLEPFRWRGTEQVYTLPWLENRIEYTADPERVMEFTACPYTRSRLSMDVLTKFHLSNHSIVVSDDDHADSLRKRFFRHLPTSERYPHIARELVDAVFEIDLGSSEPRTIHLSSRLIREVFQSLLVHLLGIEITRPLRDYIRSVDLQPGRRPMHISGLMYALSQLMPGTSVVRFLIDLAFYRGERYTRAVATELEQLIFELSIPKPDSWYAALLEMKRDRTLTNAQFRGELTSIFVSSYTLSAALSSMILCLATRPDYRPLLRDDARLRKCFVYEVLRLYPPFRQFGYERKGVWDDAERSDGETTDLMIAVLALHRSEKAWSDPASFRPERFLEPGSIGGHRFMPFGIGKRACTGRSYSMKMLVETLTYLCSEGCRLEIDVPPDLTRDAMGLPVGTSGRLISFPMDDRIIYRSGFPDRTT